MKVQLSAQNKVFHVDFNQAIDVTIPIRKTENVNCYHLDNPSFKYFKNEFFSGDLSEGGSVNCESIYLYPHASGTHTECALHIENVPVDMRHFVLPPLQLCQLITMQTSQIGTDHVLTKESFLKFNILDGIKALIFRTLPNDNSKLNKNYSDSNPAFFHPDLCLHLKSIGIHHLITDLPSIDKEDDGGALSAHKVWFLENGQLEVMRTITELVYVPNEVQDGVYAVSMHVPSIQTDAVPSRVVLYPMND